MRFLEGGFLNPGRIQVPKPLWCQSSPPLGCWICTIIYSSRTETVKVCHPGIALLDFVLSRNQRTERQAIHRSRMSLDFSNCITKDAYHV